MIYVRLCGGLGNQLFQFAAAIELKTRVNQEIAFFVDHLDMYETKRTFKLDFLFEDKSQVYIKKPNYFYVLILKYRINKVYPSIFANFIHNGNISSCKRHNNYILDDYFQEIENIGHGIQSVVDLIIVAQERFLTSNNKFCLERALAVHIRRSDYLNVSNLSTFEILEKQYYKKAIQEFKNSVQLIYTFSDEEVDTNVLLDTSIPVTIVSQYGYKDVEEFLFLASFKNVIIANSTFSFWASLVSHQNKKIVAPSKWVKSTSKNNLWVKNMNLLGYKICDIS